MKIKNCGNCFYGFLESIDEPCASCSVLVDEAPASKWTPKLRPQGWQLTDPDEENDPHE